MAMDSKIDFLRDAEKALSETVTHSDMSKIMAKLADVLEGFEMHTITRMDVETDDCLECYISALTVQCRSQKTIDRYRYVICRMMDYVKVPTRRITAPLLKGQPYCMKCGRAVKWE